MDAKKAPKKAKTAIKLPFKGRRVYAVEEVAQRACPFPDEPEWVAALDTSKKNLQGKRNIRAFVSKKHARQCEERWNILNALDKAELPKMTLDRKLENQARLMKWARSFSTNDDTDSEVRDVGEKWLLYKSKFRG